MVETTQSLIHGLKACWVSVHEHVCAWVHACVPVCQCMCICVCVCVICRNKGKEGSVGLVEAESQRSEVFASQEKMKFKEKITALGDPVNLTCIQ